MEYDLKSYDELKAELLNKMVERGCTPITVAGYRYICNSIFVHLEGWGYKTYTQEGGNRVLEHYLKTHSKNEYYSNLRTVVCRLNDVLINTWDDVHSSKGKIFNLSDEYSILIDDYCRFEKSKGLADGTIHVKRYDTSWFMTEISHLGCNYLYNISAEYIVKACVAITDHNIWGEIRVFLRYLSNENKLDVDYSTIVPHCSKPHVSPSIYTMVEVKKIENAIDRSTLLGMRDYAMILLASRMGMRSGDIVNLHKNNIDFLTDVINITQQKTGNTLRLALIPEVKHALATYLDARNIFDEDIIFLNVYAPYKPVTTSTLRNAMKKYLSLAGIDPGKRKQGPHALRSSLASSMVNDAIPYEIVRKVLGHSSSNAIKHYARIDLEKLRAYSLIPPRPTGDFLAFLEGKVRNNG